MFFGGAFFDPSPRSERRMSLGGFVSSAGIFLGGLILFVSVLEPWTVTDRAAAFPLSQNGLTVAGPFGWSLLIIGGALCLGGLAEMLSHSRRFNLGLQLFAIPAGTGALLLRSFVNPCSHLPYLFIGPHRVGGPTCPWLGTGIGVGHSMVETGAIVVIVSGVLVLAISGITTMWVRRHGRKPLAV